MKKLFALLTLTLSFVTGFAQDLSQIEMADEMQKSGKIYVVITTIVIIFIGITIYLFGIDRRLRKIEKEK